MTMTTFALLKEKTTHMDLRIATGIVFGSTFNIQHPTKMSDFIHICSPLIYFQLIFVRIAEPHSIKNSAQKFK